MSERKQDHHLIVVLQCDECGMPRVGCRDTACALASRPYAGEDVVPVEQLQGAVEALESLRAAWNEHMATCPQHATMHVPTLEEIEAWRNAPSDTASGGQEP